MPTARYGKVRRLLDSGRARAVRHTPFTIQLLYETSSFTQNVTLGVDAGSKTVGLSATTKAKELYRSEVTLRQDVVNLLSTRREARRTRRTRRLRHRAVRFNNRKKPEGWFAPSVRQKVESHVKAVGLVCSILPVRTITVETAQFDMQKIKNPGIAGEDYQHGEQDGFWNVREYILWRDGHKCQCCHGKSKDKILNVHHIESRKTGGDSPDNLVTLCETCHKAYHKGKVELKLKRNFASLRDAAFVNITRWAVYNELKRIHPDKSVRMTYGYKTKQTRITNGLDKSHCTDAYCIAGNLQAKQLDTLIIGRCIARHSRSLHVFVHSKGGRRRSAVAPHWIGKSRLQRYDSVRYDGRDCIIAGSTNGRPILRNIDWSKATISASVNPKTVKFLNRKHGSVLYQTFSN